MTGYFILIAVATLVAACVGAGIGAFLAARALIAAARIEDAARQHFRRADHPGAVDIPIPTEAEFQGGKQ